MQQQIETLWRGTSQMNAAALEGMRYGLLLATAEELVQEQSMANIKIEWFLTKIEFF
jgi:hypothetical protein